LTYRNRATSGAVTVRFGADGTAGAATASAGFSMREVKQRYPGLPDILDLSVGLPILGETQLSILGSISMLRGLK